MFGTCRDGQEIPAERDLVRLALPRRSYTQSHIDYVIEVANLVYRKRRELSGFRVLKQAEILRHFTMEFEPI